MVNVLLVEDDSLIADTLMYYLGKAESYHVTCAKTAGEALAKARDQFDLILMDILLPDADGIDLCRHMRQWHDCPVIFISCLDNSETIIRALAAGGDDFVTKPFDNNVLIARIEANLRRYHEKPFPDAANIIHCGDLTLDFNHHMVTKAGQEVKLSITEFRLLSFLMQNPGKHYTPKELYRNVWGSISAGDSRTVLVHIHNLRQKLEDAPNDPRYIVMDWGKGYYLSANPKGTGIGAK